MNLKPNKHKISFNTATMTSLGFIIVGPKPNIICTFLIHYGSPQKMLTALFDFVWTILKWTILFECLGKMFLSIEKLSLSFMSHVGPKWNIYLSHYCAKFEHEV